MEQILKAKHWQIFILAFGLPLVIDIVGTVWAIIGNNLIIMNKISPLVMLSFICGFLSWLWAVSVHLQQKLPEELRLKVGLFKLCVYFLIVYTVFMFGLFDLLIDISPAVGHAILFSIMGLMWIFSLFFICSMLYCMQFAAKTFATIELQRKVSFSDYSGEFFLFWFFPIGIWIIQPKINKMIEN
jgi:hypothetical protein